MGSMEDSINSFMRSSPRLQSKLTAVMAQSDPSLIGPTVRRLSEWLSDPTGGGLQEAYDVMINAYVASRALLSTAPISFNDWVDLFVTDLSNVAVGLDLEAENIEVLATPNSSSGAVATRLAFITSALEDDLGLLDVNLRNELEPLQTPYTNIEDGLLSAIAALDVGGVGPGQVGLFRAAMAVTAAPAYPGAALTDPLADLLDFATVNKL